MMCAKGRYIELGLIHLSLKTMGERSLATSVQERMDDIFDTMDSTDRKDVAMELESYKMRLRGENF